MMELLNETKKHIHLKASTGEVDNSFVGLKIFGDDIYIYHPENYSIDLSENSFTEDVINLLDTFSFTKISSSDTGILYSGDSDGKFRLDSYIWIIKDYLTKRYYVNREKKYVKNQNGKVNWKRTLNQTPTVSNGNIIYMDLVTERRTNIDNIIVDIHKYCVKKSVAFIGWVFNLNEANFKTINMTDELKSYYLYVLQEELNNTYDDYKKELFNNMIIVLRGLNEYVTKEIINYGVDHYHYIFERMVDKIFGNENIKEFYPKGIWLLNNYGTHTSSALRPDTILKSDNQIFLIDSKYYRFGYSGDVNDLPETSSIQKQIAYGAYAKKLHSDCEVFNAFIIPYNKLNNHFSSSEDLFYVGKAFSEVEKQNESYHYIYTFLIDLKHVIKTYNKFNHSTEVKKLIDRIRVNCSNL